MPSRVRLLVLVHRSFKGDRVALAVNGRPYLGTVTDIRRDGLRIIELDDGVYVFVTPRKEVSF